LDLIVMKNASQAGLILDYFVGLMVSFHNIIKCLPKFPLLTSLLFIRIWTWGRISLAIW
jgi:hypothetical protein